MRLPFFSSSPAHEAPPKHTKKKNKTKTSKSNGKAVEVATVSSSPTTVLSVDSAVWASSSSAASTPSSASSSSSPSTSAAQGHPSVSSNAPPPAAAPSPTRRQPGSGVTKEDLAVLLRRLDETADAITPESDLDAAVTQEELAMLLAEMPGEDDLLDAFRVFDSNGDGKITAEELRGALEMIGDDGCSVEDCRRMILEIDSVGDGCVCFTDFARMMLTAVDVQ